jgi:hypothetical protein
MPTKADFSQWNPDSASLMGVFRPVSTLNSVKNGQKRRFLHQSCDTFPASKFLQMHELKLVKPLFTVSQPDFFFAAGEEGKERRKGGRITDSLEPRIVISNEAMNSPFLKSLSSEQA